VAAAVSPAAAQVHIRVPEIVIWNRIGDRAAKNLDRHTASRQFAQDLADAGDLDPEMQRYFEQSVKTLDGRIAEDRILLELAQDIVAQETGSASDPKASSTGPVGEWLNDPKRDAVSGPLKDYLARQQALSADPKRDMVSGPLRDWLARQEAQGARDAAQRARLDASGNRDGRAFNRVRVNDSASALQSGRLLQEWTTIVVDSTGEVIVDDPRDMIEAKLTDLESELEQLRQDAAQETDPDVQRETRRRLAELDREMKNAIETLSRLVSSTKIAGSKKPEWRGKPVCKQQQTGVATMGCSYWASNMPVTIPGGDPMIVEKVELEIEEDDDGRPVAWHLSYWWRYESDPRRLIEPTLGVGGDLEPGGDGTLLMAPGKQSGSIDQSTFRLQIDMHNATATGVDLLERGHPLTLKFRRDPKDFLAVKGTPRPGAYDATAHDPIPDEASLRDRPQTATPPDPAEAPGPDDDEFLVPLTTPNAPPEPKTRE
jgi:hypothetical protein